MRSLHIPLLSRRSKTKKAIAIESRLSSLVTDRLKYIDGILTKNINN